MSRHRQRVCLNQGLRLDLNKLGRQGFVEPGSRRSRYIRWSYTYTDETIARALISSDLTDAYVGWIRVEGSTLDQTIRLISEERHFGGRQWYFVCPARRGLASVVWMPPGARSFASRKAWGRQVAYASQFEDRYSRALTGAQRIRAGLGGPDWAGIDEFDPPKPKWMRNATYRGLLEKAWAYEEAADERLVILAARLLKLG